MKTNIDSIYIEVDSALYIFDNEVTKYKNKFISIRNYQTSILKLKIYKVPYAIKEHCFLEFQELVNDKVYSDGTIVFSNEEKLNIIDAYTVRIIH